jgi:transketolase
MALEVVNASCHDHRRSADLTGSNLTKTKNDPVVSPGTTPAASSITASASMAWRRHERHGAAWRLIPYSARSGVLGLLPPFDPLAALMQQRVIHVMTHDSIGLAKTARRISRSSIWPRCAPFPICW